VLCVPEGSGGTSCQEKDKDDKFFHGDTLQRGWLAIWQRHTKSSRIKILLFAVACKQFICLVGAIPSSME
jgi:hypothetical protein